eukprot:NODE_2962_length_1079_cov_31.121359_g2717_i0.p1 GENE.NODE_2962_length_1079_cov_31.121359_g2717_i0~~NODE_2962_length_1079_cov_31.121359_g2717_i0.p1  ORF type:complete len:276 (-),score=32.77 NODE_2962_length_1079_cov_31.121359_g2717_i0:76-903(-)
MISGEDDGIYPPASRIFLSCAHENVEGGGDDHVTGTHGQREQDWENERELLYSTIARLSSRVEHLESIIQDEWYGQSSLESVPETKASRSSGARSYGSVRSTLSSSLPDGESHGARQSAHAARARASPTHSSNGRVSPLMASATQRLHPAQPIADYSHVRSRVMQYTVSPTRRGQSRESRRTQAQGTRCSSRRRRVAEILEREEDELRRGLESEELRQFTMIIVSFGHEKRRLQLLRQRRRKAWRADCEVELRFERKNEKLERQLVRAESALLSD